MARHEFRAACLEALRRTLDMPDSVASAHEHKGVQYKIIDLRDRALWATESGNYACVCEQCRDTYRGGCKRFHKIARALTLTCRSLRTGGSRPTKGRHGLLWITLVYPGTLSTNGQRVCCASTIEQAVATVNKFIDALLDCE